MMSPLNYPMARVVPPPQGNPNLIAPDGIPPYGRPTQSGQAIYEDHRFVSSKYGHFQGAIYAGPGNDSLLVDRSAHRTRVMSEQQINTYKQFQNPTSYPSDQNILQVQPIKMKFASGHGFSLNHIEDSRYLQPNSPPQIEGKRPIAQSMSDINNQEKNPDKSSISPSEKVRGNKLSPEDLGFQENEFTFKTGLIKEATSSEKQSPPAVKKELRQVEGGSASREAATSSSAQKRINKSTSIKQLEEEIKATKEKLRQLEERLKLEYETVEEHASDHENDQA